MMQYKGCPICESFGIKEFLNIQNVPVHQNYILKNKKEALGTNVGDLEIYICEDCGFIFNRSFDSNKLSYGSNYDNTQELSPYFKEYIGEELTYLKQSFNLKGKIVIEVGCGKGAFLRQLVEETGCNGIGFDPSYTGEETLLSGKLRFIKDFYTEEYSDFKADFIVCRHVIEHIPDPINFLEGIKKSLESSRRPICFFETPSVEWILKNKIMYDFFYEHCSYFDDVSIIQAFEKTGFNILNIKHEFSGQYLWITAEAKDNVTTMASDKRIGHLKNLSLEYAKDFDMQVEYWKKQLAILNKDGKVSVWGAGAKGVTFTNLVDPERKMIDSIIDINQNKHGCFTPKTAHEIIDYKGIINRNIKTIIIMNDNYYNEINKILANNNIDVKLLLGASRK